MDFSDKQPLLEAAVEQALNPILITTAELDPPGPHIVYANSAFAHVTGYSVEEVIGATPRILQGPATSRDMLDRLKAALRADQPFQGHTWNYRKDGTPYRVEWLITPVSIGNGGADYFVSVQRDITALYRTQAQLHEETRRLNALLEAAGDAIITADDQGIIHQFNPAAEQMFGLSAEAIIGTRLNQLMPEPHASQHDDYIARYERTGDPHIIGMGREVEAVHADGSQFPVALNVTDTGLTDPRLFVGILHDLTRRKQAEQERLHYHANFDTVTGLPTRRYTLTLLADAIRRSQRGERPVAVVALTLPQVTRISQGFGEEMADHLFQKAVNSLRDALANHPHFIGIGERGRFLVVLEGLEEKGLRLSVFMQELLARMGAELAEESPDLRLDPRAGAALYPDDGADEETLVAQAEAALSRSLDSDGPAFHLADPAENERLRDQLALEADLHHALERAELFLVYQPQFDLASGAIVGSEALLRWQHPERGVISPAQFIPMLEETGLIDPVGEWLLREALGQAMAWSEGDLPLPMAVNLSPRQFQSGRLLEQITDALAETGFPEQRLELEITESLLLASEDNIHQILATLQGMGIELALDDFGTGYSALSYLQAFPLTTLKIDRAFVAASSDSKQSEELLRGIVGLGRGLSMDVVAEGIETEAQRTFLRDLGCPRAQGFGLARPMTGPAFAELLAESRDS